MARKFLDEVRTDITTKLADNTTGDISALDVREVLRDLLDSSISDEAAFTNALTPPVVSMALDATWKPLTDANVTGGVAFDMVVGGDAEFLRMLPSDSGIRGSAVAGYSYNVKGSISIDAATNTSIQVAMGMNGEPGVLVQTIIGTNGVRFTGAYLERYILSAPADALFQLLVRAPDGPTTASISSRGFGAIILPTNNP